MGEFRFPPLKIEAVGKKQACGCSPASQRPSSFALSSGRREIPCGNSLPEHMLAGVDEPEKNSFDFIRITTSDSSLAMRRPPLQEGGCRPRLKDQDPKPDQDHPNDDPYPEGGTPVPSKLRYPRITCNPEVGSSVCQMRKRCFRVPGFPDIDKIIGGLNHDAFRIATYAARTLDWISGIDQHDSRRFYWNWGQEGSEWAHLWGHRTRARSAGLWWWFGPYSDQALQRVRKQVKDIASVLKNLLTYNCKWTRGEDAHARHRNGTTYLYRSFWDSAQTWRGSTWWNNRVLTFFHESCHYFFVKNGGHAFSNVCTEEDGKAKPWACYRDLGDGADWWFYGGEPHKLAMSSDRELVFVNPDNFVCWAFSRFSDEQWGDCNGPRIPPWGLTPGKKGIP